MLGVQLNAPTMNVNGPSMERRDQDDRRCHRRFHHRLSRLGVQPSMGASEAAPHGLGSVERPYDERQWAIDATRQP
jgi:hypothetical protein